MNKLSVLLNYFFTGIGYGAISYLCILTFGYAGVVPTVKSLVSVFIISGLIGLLSMIMRTDLPLMAALGIHFVGTFFLFLIMMLVNNWPVNWWAILVFLLIYVVIWLICVLEQKRAISRINLQIRKRNKK
jgi:hypothetical protein